MKNLWHYESPISTLWIAEEHNHITHIAFSHEFSYEYRLNETPLIKQAIRELTEYFNGDRREFTLPLSPKGTDFQTSVWQALLDIPYGETRSYKDIAYQVNSPRAYRAVGLANNRNPLAIIIPCHRVIGHNGSLTGYGGGLHIKQFLLDLEQRPIEKEHFFNYGKKEIEYLQKQDPILGAAIEKIGHIQRNVIPDIFMALINSIIGQQISTKAQKTIWRRIKTSISPLTPQTIDSLTLEKLQAYGISWRKASYIKEMTQFIMDGSLDLSQLSQMTDEEVIAYLTKIKGVGKWTAEMLLIFSMQRPNILSWGDLAIHRGLRMLYQQKEISPEFFTQCQEKYSPYASIASLYLWEIAGGAIPELIDPAG